MFAAGRRSHKNQWLWEARLGPIVSLKQLGVLMRIGRGAAAEYFQLNITAIFNGMWGAGWYQYSIPYIYLKALTAQYHYPFTRSDVVELFTLMVAVEQGGGAGRHRCLGQALVSVVVLLRMHQFTDSRTIFGGVGFCRGVRCFH